MATSALIACSRDVHDYLGILLSIHSTYRIWFDNISAYYYSHDYCKKGDDNKHYIKAMLSFWTDIALMMFF